MTAANRLIEVQLPAIPLVHGQPHVLVRGVLESYMGLAASTLAGYMRDHAPVGATGHLRQGIQHDVAFTSPVDVVGRAFSSLPHAIVVDEGRRPGPISRAGLASLALWVRRKLGLSGKEARHALYAIASKIRTRGFQGAHFADDGMTDARPAIEAVLNEMLAELALALVETGGGTR